MMESLWLRPLLVLVMALGVFVLAAGIWSTGFLRLAAIVSAHDNQNMDDYHDAHGNQNNQHNHGNPSNLDNQPLSEAEIEQLLMPYRKLATVLQPCLSPEPLGFDQSKMGGIPNLNGFDHWPTCDACGSPLKFVLQTYRNDFPSFYFPETMDLFQLFRCPNFKCPEAFGDHCDLKMFAYYFGGLPVDRNKDLAVPILPAADPNFEGPVPDCRFEPVVVPDYPAYDDYPGQAWQEIESRLSEDQVYDVMDKYYPRVGTKFGGYPHWEQRPRYPVCSCGRTKEFFFQLSSEEPELSRATRTSPLDWSPHGIMIGDLGNIYFFVCPECGLKSIETLWDCG